MIFEAEIVTSGQKKKKKQVRESHENIIKQ